MQTREEPLRMDRPRFTFDALPSGDVEIIFGWGDVAVLPKEQAERLYSWLGRVLSGQEG